MSPDSSLAEMLARQIKASGPITISEYMRAANEAYYARQDPFGQAGDFITAPEISQMFGEMVGLWFTDFWMQQNRPENINYVELGPGRGTLAADALRCMHKFGLQAEVHFVENSPLLRGVQSAAVPSAHFHDRIDSLPVRGPLFILANEFFDALPVRQFVVTQDGWREQLVACDDDGNFRAVAGERPVDDLIPREVAAAPAGSVFETSPQSGDIAFQLASMLMERGGVLLIIDYGYTQPGLGSTLQAVRDHRYSDPFRMPGQSDLTAHVNFAEIANLARLKGLNVSGPTRQGEWLQRLGINQRCEMLTRSHPQRREEIIAARDRLVSAQQMGSLFKVMAIAAPGWPSPEGFADRAV